jgi:EAL domain-containing protein (putative c-di-GMP-specific phosphodiesterase class I)
MDDPLAYTPDGEENQYFCSFYNIEEHFDEFAKFARRKMLGNKIPAPSHDIRGVEPVLSAKQAQSGGIFKQLKGFKGGFFNANSLVSIERGLAGVDLRPALRRQAVCAAIPDMMVRRVFDEVYINIAHLRETLRLDVDLLSNRWLFKYLTELLDIRMIELMKEDPSTHLGLPLSLNLNVKTLMSDAFAAFDAAIKPSAKVSIVLELHVADVFEDMQAFTIARNQVQRLGYRICLDGLTNLSFAQIKRETLGFDLVKLQWNADIASTIESEENREIAKLIKACGANRIILTRCDNKQAVDYGQAMGVSLFQGRYLDKLMNPAATVEN